MKRDLSKDSTPSMYSSGDEPVNHQQVQARAVHLADSATYDMSHGLKHFKDALKSINALRDHHAKYPGLHQEQNALSAARAMRPTQSGRAAQLSAISKRVGAK